MPIVQNWEQWLNKTGLVSVSAGMNKFLLIGPMLSIATMLNAQDNNSAINGSVLSAKTQTPIVGATISVSTGQKVISDSAGRYRLQGLKPGSVNLNATALGFSSETRFNLVLTNGNEQEINFQLTEASADLGDVTVRSNRRTARATTLETPLSVQKLTSEEIKSNPGGNFDISRVISSLPGVGGTAATAGFRNDIIIRGGAPNENVFYLDGIEIPQINHFATQGSAGGPTGILNVSFIEEVKLSSSAFEARYDNALSSVFQFTQKRGNSQRNQGNFRLSGTEAALTLEGPIDKKTTYLASVRRSYLQLLFQALDLPIRPNYWDFQTKITRQLSKRTTLSFIGVGALDEFRFAAPKEATPEKLFELNSSPSIQQQNYTVGATLRHSIKDGFLQVALSRNYLRNQQEQFTDNLNRSGRQTLDLVSTEAENKLRAEVNQTLGAVKLSYGLVAQWAQYTANQFVLVRAAQADASGNIIVPEQTSRFNTDINFLRAGAFVQAGTKLLDGRLGLSAGIRADGNGFTTGGWNLGRTLSPRISASYQLSQSWTVNATAGTYYKIAPYTVLGYQQNNRFINRDARYLGSDHLAAGLEFLPSSTTRFTLEGFYKRYRNVPITVRNGISLSNLGADFGVLGNEPVVTNGRGRAYGFEFFAQQKLTKRFYGFLSYTYFRSLYTNANGRFVRSAWENRHLFSFTWGYKFSRNWELGLKFRFQGGNPYTGFDTLLSRQNFALLGRGVLDFRRLNEERLGRFHASDVRIDKKWNFRRFTLDLFLDVTNWYIARNPAIPVYTFARTADNSAFRTTDGQPLQTNGRNAIPTFLANDEPSVVPTIGLIVEF